MKPRTHLQLVCIDIFRALYGCKVAVKTAGQFNTFAGIVIASPAPLMPRLVCRNSGPNI